MPILSKAINQNKLSPNVPHYYTRIFTYFDEIEIPETSFMQTLKSISSILNEIDQHHFKSPEDYFLYIISICEHITSKIFQKSINQKEIYEKYSTQFNQIVDLIKEIYSKFEDSFAQSRTNEYNSFKGNNTSSKIELEFDLTSELDIKKAIIKEFVLPYKYEIKKDKVINRGYVPIIYQGKIIYQSESKSFRGHIIENEITPMGYPFYGIDIIHPKNENEFIEFVNELIAIFKHNIEQRKGYKLLWNGTKSKPEEEVQIFFDNQIIELAQRRGIEVSRENETGRGPVDFKFIESVEHKAHLEIKKASNPKLIKGLSKQLVTYLKADKLDIGFYLIIQFFDNEDKIINTFKQQISKLRLDNNIKIFTIFIDARRNKKSASKL